ncbi:MAG: hypothetical protein IJI71_10065 [Clostridia bacterium]|nr:hypothetical protein [Clostridia bacterium]MBR2700342.1 hypothetical protein [Clostridia bacterium]
MLQRILPAIHLTVSPFEHALKAVVPAWNVIRHARGDDHLICFLVLLHAAVKLQEQLLPVVVVLILENRDEFILCAKIDSGVTKHVTFKAQSIDTLISKKETTDHVSNLLLIV